MAASKKIAPIAARAELSATEARGLALRAQGIGDIGLRHPIDVLNCLGVIQLDSVNALARSHELVPFTRLGPCSTVAMRHAIYEQRRGFEYWGHEASWLPIDEYRYFLPRMSNRRERWRTVGDVDSLPYTQVLERIRAEGPLRAADFEDTRETRGSWWNWKPAKQALEYLFASGELMCANRTAGFARVYDVTERVLPPTIDTTNPGPALATRHLLLRAIQALGVATGSEAGGYYRLRPLDWRSALNDLIQAGDVVPVAVEEWPSVAFATPNALEEIRAIPIHTPVFLSPFDSILWDRGRLLRMHGFHFRVEMYTPKPRRQFGYYVAPLLVSGKLAGRADLKHDRQEHVLRVQGMWLDDATPEDAAYALRDLATHLTAPNVDVMTTHPEIARSAVERALTRNGMPTRRDTS